MGRRIRLVLAPGLLLVAAVGCSTVGESLGFSSPAYPLNKNAKAIRDAAPVPAPVPRELAMELLPTHLVVPGDSLLVQPVEFDSPVRLPPDQPVQPDGTIDLGVYGRPVVAGKTLAQVEVIVRDAIAIRAKEKNQTAVTVRLLSRPADVFYVLGEVNAPGAFPVTGSDNVLSAITLAGGPTRKASLQNIVLSRPTTPDSCRVVYPVCYTDITQLGDTTTNYQLLPGDRIFVPSKRMFEDFFGRCRQGGPCSRPQVPCFGGACGAGTTTATPPGMMPAIPAAPAGMIP